MALVALLIALIYLISAGLLLITTARLHQPLNLVVAGCLWVILFGLSLKFWRLGGFTLLYGLWMLAMIGGLYGLRYYFRQTK